MRTMILLVISQIIKIKLKDHEQLIRLLAYYIIE